MFGVMQHLNIDIVICKNPTDAVLKGYEYSSDEYKPIEITEIVVIREGTEKGNPTVDLILQDQEGNKFVVTVTGKLLKAIPC